MTINHSLYEVDWQLPDDEESRDDVESPDDVESKVPRGDRNRVAKHPVRDHKHLVRDQAGSMARLAGVLAGADTVAIVGYRESGLVVEAAQPVRATLAPGTVVAMHPCLGGRRRGAIGSLLTGPQHWCRCVPPRGFAYAALVASPSLASSGRLLLVANRQRRLTELNLRVASAYLAQGRDPAPPRVVDLR